MRLTKKLSFLFLFVSLLQIIACSSSKSISGQQDLIIGKWVLESASFNGQVIDAGLLGGMISFEFDKHGIATFTTPEGHIESGRYEVKSNLLIDPDSPNEPPVDILKLTREQFVMSMKEEGEIVVMTFKPKQ